MYYAFVVTIVVIIVGMFFGIDTTIGKDEYGNITTVLHMKWWMWLTIGYATYTMDRASRSYWPYIVTMATIPMTILSAIFQKLTFTNQIIALSIFVAIAYFFIYKILGFSDEDKARRRLFYG